MTRKLTVMEVDDYGCPINYDGACRHPDANEDENGYDACYPVYDYIPSWCPLKEGEVLVRMPRGNYDEAA